MRPFSFILRYEFNKNNQVIKEIDPLGKEFLRQYDELGRPIETTDQKGVKASYAYNDFNEIKEVREAVATGDEAATVYDYDDNGNLISITNAENGTIEYEYDGLGRRTKEFDDDNSFKEVQYDGNGNIVSEIRRDGAVIWRKYDDLNRLTEVREDNQEGELLQEFAYDDLSRMTRAIDYNEGRQTHTVDYEYDALHRV